MKLLKNKKRGIIAMTTAVLMLLTACGQPAKNNNSGGGADDFKFVSYPIQTDVTLKYWVELNANVSISSESLTKTPFGQELMKNMGVNIEFIHPPVGQTTEQLGILLTSNSLPDIIEYNWSALSGGAAKALKEGYIIKLNDVFASDAPNLTAYLKSQPGYDKDTKTDDGSYYAFPFIRGDDFLTVSAGPILRGDWLTDLGLPIPETIDEWHTVLTAFRDRKGATSPLSFTNGGGSSWFREGDFSGAYGTPRNFFIDGEKVVYGPYDPRYKDFLTEMAKWYEEGLIDANIANVEGSTLDSNILNSKTGATIGYGGSLLGRLTQSMAGKDDKFKLVAAKHPVLTKGETPVFGQRSPIVDTIGAAITSSCKNVGLAARMLDYAYSDKGHLLYNFGIEGESYNMVDNYPTYTDLIMKNPDGLSITQAMSRYIRGSYSGPFVQDKAYMEQYYTLDEQKEALVRWSDTDTSQKRSLPVSVTFLPEESSEISTILNDINTRVDEMTMKFIMGIEPMDNFDKYISDLKSFGMERAIEIQQNAFDRYIKRN